jgi:intracellular septation protein
MLTLLLDFFPLLAFFAAFSLSGGSIYPATLALMIASVVQVGGHLIWKRRVQKLHLFNLGLALVLGGLTLWLRNDRFIKWKPTVFLWLMALILLGRQWLRGELTVRTIVEAVAKEKLGVPEPAWRQINSVWGFTMFAAGALNLVVAYQLPLKSWVLFKVWGLTIVNVLLMVYTSLVISRHSPKEADPKP